MAEAVGAVRIDLFANLAEWTDGLNKAEGQLNRFAKNTEKTSKQLITAGRNLTLGLSAPIVAFGALALKAASDAEALRGDIALSFGEAADEVNAWAETTGDALGRSTQQIQRAALSFQQLFEDIAPTEEAAADLSMRFTELSQDFAAFNNVSSEQGVKALQGALAGAGKAVKRLGVDISDGAVQQKAFELGLAGANVELTEQQKVLARAAIISEGFKNIQGDILNDQDEGAEKTARLRAEFEEMQVALGDELLPIYKELLGGIIDLIKGFKSLSPEVKGIVVATAGIAAAVGPAVLVIGGLTKAAGLAAIAFKGLGLTFLGVGADAGKMSNKIAGAALRLAAFGTAAYSVGQIAGSALDSLDLGGTNKSIRDMGEAIKAAGYSGETGRQALAYYFEELKKGNKLSTEAVLSYAKFAGGVNNVAADSVKAADDLSGVSDGVSEVDQSISDLLATMGDLGGKMKETTDEFAALRAQLDPVAAALDTYKTNLASAIALGYDQEQAQRVLGVAFVESVSDVENFRDSLATLPPELQALVTRRDQIALFIRTWGEMAQANADALEVEKELDAERAQLAADGVQAGDDAIRAIMDYGRSLTEQFDPMAVFEARLRGINEAFALGAITAATYEKAKAAAFADTPEGAAQVDLINTLTDGLTDAAFATEDFGEAIEAMLKQILQAQIVRPMIQNAVSGLFPQVAPAMQAPVGGGFDIASAIGTFTSFLGFGGTRDKGGPGLPGMSYRISSGVAEDFVPETPGQFVRGPGNVAPSGNVTFIVNATDPNAFRASERQMSRRARRNLGV